MTAVVFSSNLKLLKKKKRKKKILLGASCFLAYKLLVVIIIIQIPKVTLRFKSFGRLNSKKRLNANIISSFDAYTHRNKRTAER